MTISLSYSCDYDIIKYARSYLVCVHARVKGAKLAGTVRFFVNDLMATFFPSIEIWI